MPSPFPGMDPYIEKPSLWQDFHNDLASEIKRRITANLSEEYFVRLTPRVTYEGVEISAPRTMYPDTAVVKEQLAEYRVAAPILLLPPIESENIEPADFKQQSLEIRTADEERIVTVIELLSRVNKRPSHEAYRAYREKRRQLLNSDTNLLEIDLLRGGERIELADPLPDAPYFIFLSRSKKYPRVGVWPLSLREPIPLLPVPLLEPDPDVPLDLNSSIQTIYNVSRYQRSIDYHKPPPAPRFTDADAAWLDEFLRAKGLR